MFIYWSLAMPIFVLTITNNTNKKISHLTHSSLMSFIMKNHGIFRAKPSHSISYFMRLNYIQFSDLLKNRAHINHLIWFGWVFRKLNEKKPCTNILKRIGGGGQDEWRDEMSTVFLMVFQKQGSSHIFWKMRNWQFHFFQ